ncbi:Protein of unknown function [Azospirillum sp. RU38E]|nr:Protein of unknown function [Azospirillum sp. RU38E]SNS08771.1 Protein of unknown function [Azospirillum sp. RU37A]
MNIFKPGNEKNINFWLSSILFMNDNEEFFHGVNILIKEIKNFYSKSIGKKEKDFSDRIIRFLESTSLGESIFSCSFSRHSDLLSQWRGYCPPSGGVSIGLSRKIFHSLSDQYAGVSGNLMRVIYDEDEKIFVARSVIENSIGEFLSIVKEQGCNERDFLFVSFCEYLAILGSCFKNPGFYEEEEFRYIWKYPYYDIIREIYDPAFWNINKKFRSARGLMIPYVEKFFYVEGSNVELCIGPAPRQNLNEISVMNFIRQNTIKPKITLSKTTYRAN